MFLFFIKFYQIVALMIPNFLKSVLKASKHSIYVQMTLQEEAKIKIEALIFFLTQCLLCWKSLVHAKIIVSQT